MADYTVEDGVDVLGRYQILNEIGRGSFAPVYRAWDEQEQIYVAIKLFNLEDVDDSIDDIHQEIAIMKELNRTRPQLVTYLSSYVVDSSLWIIMEYLEAGSVADILKQYGPLDEPCCAYILKELLTALEFVHAELKIHRDVKAGNMLVGADGCIKLADFGVTGKLKDNSDKRTTKIGTPFWMAPEVIMENGYDGCADVWSTGITAIELATGYPPYAKDWSSSVNPIRVIFEIAQNPPPKLEGDNFSDKFKDFVGCCLKKDPTLRPTASSLLSHEFLKDAVIPELWKDRVSMMIQITAILRETEPLYDRSCLSSSSDSVNEWDFTSHSVNSNTGRPALRRGGSVSTPYGQLSSKNSSDDLENADSSTTTLPRTALRRSQSVNANGGDEGGEKLFSRAPVTRGIARHRSLNMPYPKPSSLEPSKSHGLDSNTVNKKKPVRGVSRSQSVGCDAFGSSARKLDTSKRVPKQISSKSSSSAGGLDATGSEISEANKLVLDALCPDSDSEDITDPSVGSVGSSSSDSANSSSNALTTVSAKGDTPTQSGQASFRASLTRKTAMNYAVSTDDYDEHGLIVSGDACLVDSFDEEDHAGNVATVVTPRSEAVSPRQGGEKSLLPFKTVLKILSDAHVSGGISDLSDNEPNERMYSDLFMGAVKPTLQYVRDLMNADFDEEVIEIQQKRKLKVKLEQMQATNTKQNQKVMTALGSLESLDKQESDLQANHEISKEILKVLIASLTALDVHSRGELTKVFTTTLTTYCEEDMEGLDEDSS